MIHAVGGYVLFLILMLLVTPGSLPGVISGMGGLAGLYAGARTQEFLVELPTT